MKETIQDKMKDNENGMNTKKSCWIQKFDEQRKRQQSTQQNPENVIKETSKT